jgi:hypothetical protein
MRTHHLVSPIFGLALALAAPRLAAPQQGSMAAPASGPAAAPAPCVSTLALSSLESNPDAVSAATKLAAQIVGNYNDDSAKHVPEIGTFWGTFNEKLFEAVHPDCANAKLAQKASTQTAKTKATTSQTNTQTGASGSGSGATSAAQKVGIPQLLAFAVENGAIADSVSGTTMTLSTTPYGFAYAFAKNEDTADRYQSEPALTHTGISATFNVADTADPLQSASRKAVSQWQIKYTFRDTSSRSLAVNCLYLFETTNCRSRADLDKPPTSKLSAAANEVVKGLSNSEFYSIRSTLQEPENNVYKQAWSSTLQKLVTAPPAAADTDQSQKDQGIGKALLQLLDKDPAFQQALGSYAVELNGSSSNLAVLVGNLEAADENYAKAETQFETEVKDLTKGWNGALTFSQKFPSPTTTSTSTTTTTVSPPAYLAPELDITFAPKSDSEKKAGAKAGAGTSGAQVVPSFTGNFSGSFYSNPNTTLHESTFRGAQTALQFQWDLGGGPFNKVKSAGDDSKMTLSCSGNYQRLQENEDQKGKRPDLVTGNVKLEIPISSGVSFPLAVTFGNATSQVKGNYVLGNFGISFDLDALVALMKLKQ